MVRTKKQVIDSLAIKNKEMTSTEFYADNVPASPLPTLMLYDTNFSHSSSPHWLPPPTPVLESETLHFEPPYVMNNFWPPPVSDQQQTSKKLSDGKKLEAMFSNLNQEEIKEMMTDCHGNEDEAILRLITRNDYLENIRHRIRLNNNVQPILKEIRKVVSNPITRHTSKPIVLPSSTQPPLPPSHVSQPQPIKKVIQQKPLLLPLPSNEIPKVAVVPLPSAAAITTTTTIKSPEKSSKVTEKVKPAKMVLEKPTMHKTHKKHHRASINSSNSGSGTTSGGMHSTGRLTLDDALQQIKDSKSNEESDGYAGWSAARLRAFKMIEKNPNSYYYRFNAPGEQQKKGKWTEEENALFLNRLKQVGANSQWGIFSIAIPGRVGYQCSNYYRFMIESGQLYDPNYVLDEKGKARYLFDKKTEDGVVEKIFRKHSKHGSMSLHEMITTTSTTTAKKRKQQTRRIESDEEDDPTFKIKKSSTTSVASKKKQIPSKDATKTQYPLILPAGVRMTRQRLQQQQLENEQKS